ncbi:DUF1918 domain-containing protein [Cellulomonas soli]|uniref:DUF1918 domain-containing protein n=1 Tax=Cellulomonas soli TaxID=931535 RepID=UPI003F86FD79
MQAAVGDEVVVHGRSVGSSERHGRILEVKGADGGPPYTVLFDDGHESLVFPGPDLQLYHHETGQHAGGHAHPGYEPGPH